MALNNTEVRLLSVPLTKDYKHTLYFESKSAQTSYFAGKTKTYKTDFNYQRKDQFIRYPEDYDTLLNMGVNYVMYKNTKYGNKYYYAFITDMKYYSDGATDIYIETDVMQTWLFDYNVQPSFVEREHTDDDTIGANLVPEGIDTGDFITEYVKTSGMFNHLCIVIATTLDPEMVNDGGHLVHGIYTGTNYYYAPLSVEGAKSVNSFIKMYAEDGKAEAIQAVFIAPTELITGESTPVSGSTVAWLANNYYGDNTVYPPFNKSFTVGTGLTVGEHTPRNNKLFCYPYNYYMVSNNQGGSAIFYREFFDNGQPSFKVVGSLSPGCSIRCAPENYKGVGVNYGESVTLGKFPICSWPTDVYINWLTQNSANIALSTVGNVVSIVGGVATQNYGAAGAGVMGIASTVADVYQHSLIPPQLEGNINSGDVITGVGQNNFIVYRMSVTNEFAKIIDGYFDMFGYKTNKVKAPNKNHRAQWWYTKTIDVIITGNVPQKDLDTIKDNYNRGITFWKNGSNLGNYELDNSIV